MKNLFLLSISIIIFQSCTIPSDDVSNTWPVTNRTWIGPDFWASRLQDWELKNGNLVCNFSGPNRSLYYLTKQLGIEGNFSTSTTFSFLNTTATNNNWVGFRVGSKGQFNDYRDNAVYGAGLNAGITAKGQLFFGAPAADSTIMTGNIPSFPVELTFTAQRQEDGQYLIELTARSNSELEPFISLDQIVDSKTLQGSIALISHFPESESRTIASASFGPWTVNGTRVQEDTDKAYGPIMFNQFTLNRGSMRYTVQMAPIGSDDDATAYFEIKTVGNEWLTIGNAKVEPSSRTATFEFTEWQDSLDIDYRVRYQYLGMNNTKRTALHEGTIGKDPMDKDEIVVAGFTGNNDLGFPNNDMIANVPKHKPDLLFFSGDQIYEGVGGFGPQRAPVDKATLDYLRKWYIFGWTYRELLRSTPSVSLPDDHDVYHGNVWGAGGRATPTGLAGNDAQDAGGYKMPAEWVNMIQRTQTSHLPAPYDPTPIEQGIGVYYTSLQIGKTDFAIIEDRKWKEAPKTLLPEAEINNGWAQNRNWNATTQGDVPEAPLLGKRQLDFLESWTQDWTNNVAIKTVLSQTIFANVATLPEEEFHDRIVPKLRILAADEYPPNDRPVSDMDSNGWPQSGRNRAVAIMRKGMAFHIAGDQHLGSTVQYGVENWNDAGFAFCVPAVSNIWPRRWYPQIGGENRNPESPKYTGDFVDGFGNKMTVHAVSNPVFTGREPARLYDRATGYGIIKLNTNTRDITMECWERDIDPEGPNARQYPGWPITINQMNNGYGNRTMEPVEVPNNAVVQVVNSETGEVLYTVRGSGTSFTAQVPLIGNYEVKVVN